MTAFYPPNLKGHYLLDRLKSLNFFTSVIFHQVWRNYLNLAKDRGRVIGEPKLRLGDKEINVMGIRNNEEIAFNDKDTFYNDLLVIEQTERQAHLFYIFKVTMDPRGRLFKVSHLLEQVAASYTALRPHKYVPGRTALVQDRDNVIVARTDTKGNVITDYKEHKGFFGINVHDSAGYLNSSIGCTVLEPESEDNDNQFKKHFKPLIESITNKEAVDYAVINKNAVIELAKSAAYKSTPDRNILDTICFRAPFLPYKTVEKNGIV
jgi:hypothetical protein